MEYNDISLLPCPFCGNEEIEIRKNGIGDFYCYCNGDEETVACGASTSDQRCETPETAARRWNSRTTSTLPQEPVTGEIKADGWQPIETAPKDGSNILLARRTFYDGFLGKPASGEWFTVYGFWARSCSKWAYYCSEGIEYFTVPGAPVLWHPIPKPEIDYHDENAAMERETLKAHSEAEDLLKDHEPLFKLGIK